MAEARALSRLLQLASPLLPVGAYSYSQGLEWAIECKEVHDMDTAKAWISDVLESYQAHFELPMLYRLYQAWQANGVALIAELDQEYQSGRDTAEALAETRQMGYSLVRLLNGLTDDSATILPAINALAQPAFPTIYAAQAVAWGISPEDALHGYAWGWLENQASACMKAIPLGQVAGQKIVLAMGEKLPDVVAFAMRLPDHEISNFNPLLSIAGCLHETQYSRLFRS